VAGINNDVLYGSNVDFSGSFPVSGQINLNGELLVGATVAPFIRPYVPTGSNGLVVNKGPGTIDFTLSNIPNGALQNPTFTVTAGTGLTGGGGAGLGGSVSLSLSTPVSVANGGTGENNAATSGTILVGNGTGFVPTTSTYPSTNAINTLLYASSANVMAALATANSGVLVTSSTGVPSILAAGTAGALLQAGTTNAWTTATYPGSSGGSGKILYDNGTNFIESTPTFPASASATSRKIIVSDGTNWNASTETWAVPGTSGNVLTSDGTNWTSASPAAIYITKTLTNSQIKNLHGTPIQWLAAPGAGKVYVVLEAWGKMIYGGSNVFTAAASQIVSIYYGTSLAAVQNVNGIISNAGIVAAASNYSTCSGLTTTNNSAIANFENVALNLYNPIATEIGGNAANNNTMSMAMVYYIMSI
jgi:hypothetical protein